MPKKFNSKTPVVYANALYESIKVNDKQENGEISSCIKRDIEILSKAMVMLKKHFGRNYLLQLGKFLNPENAQKIFKNNYFKKLLILIKDNNRVFLIPKIIEHFNRIEKKNSNQIDVTIIFANNHEQDEKVNQIVSALIKYLKKGIKFKVKIDPEILGGCVIIFNSYVIDASINNALKRFKDNAITQTSIILSKKNRRF